MTNGAGPEAPRSGRVPPTRHERASDRQPDLKRFALPPNMLCNFLYSQPSNNLEASLLNE